VGGERGTNVLLVASLTQHSGWLEVAIRSESSSCGRWPGAQARNPQLYTRMALREHLPTLWSHSVV